MHIITVVVSAGWVRRSFLFFNTVDFLSHRVVIETAIVESWLNLICQIGERYVFPTLRSLADWRVCASLVFSPISEQTALTAEPTEAAVQATNG